MSSLDENESIVLPSIGNVIIDGDIKNLPTDTIKEINGVIDVFKFQDYLNKNSLFDIWSTYYSGKGYITIYPFASAKESISDKSEVFGVIKSSIELIEKLNDETIYQNGWESAMFYDNTESEIIRHILT